MTDSSSTSKPLVSVIVAVRNAEKTLERTLASIVAQDYRNKEIVLIDGASTDGSMRVVEGFREHLAVAISEPDAGIADAYNKGIRNARGDWLYFLNADDVFTSPSTLSDIFASADFGAYDLVVGKVLADNGILFDGRYSWKLLMKNTVHHQAIFYKGDLLRRSPYNTEYRRYGHDHEHNLMLWKSRATVKYLDKVVALWSAGGISDSAKWRDYREEFRVRRNVVGRAAWLWNGFTFVRFGLKTLRLRLRKNARAAAVPL